MILEIPVTIHTTSGHVFRDVIIKEFHEEYVAVETPDKEEVHIFYGGIERIGNGENHD